ncbi:MAG TPA: alpha/beta fold hydrolase [Lacunisphaera sp.]|nr:alpha/beta fold hydrolase [Lacunisphaera sp.]
MSVVLHHTDLGGEGNPPMLVLHGLLGSSRNWLSTGRDLARHFHVFALDARNHGKSPHADEMGYEAMGDDILAWMDARQMTRAAIVGHSMGGKTAMLLACRHPARVARLVVVDIAPKDYSWAAHRAEFAAMHELDLASLTSRSEAELRFEARVPNLGMRKFLSTNLVHGDDGLWRWQINLPALTGALPILEKNCLEPGDRFAGATLFVLGGRSRYAESGDHALIRGHFPAVQIEVIAESGHNPHMDQRETFVQLVTRRGSPDAG